MKRHMCIRITGRVQGVGFRYAVLREAKRLGIVGFVRNESDGSVHIEAEGESGALERFFEWCRRGPSFASVEGVTHETSDAVRGFADFTQA